MPKKNNILFIISSLALIVGLILSIVSGMELCTSSCQAAHQYSYFGMKFEYVGIAFFLIMLTTHFLSLKYPALSFLTVLLLAGALGSEIWFIFVQKYQIKQWCPICLSIAATIFIASIAYAAGLFSDKYAFVQDDQRRNLMHKTSQGLSSLLIAFLGLTLAYFGVVRDNQLQAVENTVKENIVFGNKDSSIDVYLFTDWACPACRSVEPTITKMAPKVMKEARLTFVDFAIHPETLNYTPYNLAFMVHNKDQYFKLRDALTELAQKNSAPTDEDIQKLAKENGASLKELNYADVTLANKFFTHLGKEFDIHSTPTMVIINKEAKKGKKLQGGTEITEENVLKYINELKKP